MHKKLKHLVVVGLFAIGLAVGGLFPTQAARAEGNDLQCWYFWWQEPQCTFCAFQCLPGGECCITGPN
jgi:hypothetical protein